MTYDNLYDMLIEANYPPSAARVITDDVFAQSEDMPPRHTEPSNVEHQRFEELRPVEPPLGVSTNDISGLLQTLRDALEIDSELPAAYVEGRTLLTPIEPAQPDPDPDPAIAYRAQLVEFANALGWSYGDLTSARDTVEDMMIRMVRVTEQAPDGFDLGVMGSVYQHMKRAADALFEARIALAPYIDAADE